MVGKDKRNINEMKSLSDIHKEQIINFIKNKFQESKSVKIVFPRIPEWLITLLREFEGELYLNVLYDDKEKVMGLKGNIKLSKYICNRYIIFDDKSCITFTDDCYSTYSIFCG